MVTMDPRKVEADQLSKQGQQQFNGSQFEGAFQSWEKALKIYRDIKDRLGEGQSLGSLGNAYYSLGNYPKAIEFQKQSLAIARELKYRDGEQLALHNMASAFEKQKRLESAIDYYQQAVVVIERIRQENRKLDPTIQASYTKTVTDTYQNLAKLLIAQGRR